MIVSDPKVHGPTQEKEPRIQLTATAFLDSGEKTKVHISTLFQHRAGEKFAEVTHALANFINSGVVTKAQCLQKRAELMAV